MLTTWLWFISVPIMILFLIKVGWKALLPWQRWYVMIAAAVFPMAVVFIDMEVPVPLPNALQVPFGVGLFVAWMIVVFGGVAAAVWQIRYWQQKRRL